MITTNSTRQPARQRMALTGPLCAVVFIGGLVVAGFLVPASAPPNLPSSTPQQLQQYFLDNGNLALVTALVHVVTALLLGLFTASAAGLVRSTETRPTGLAEAAVLGGALSAAFLLGSALFTATLGAEQITGSAATVSALRQLSFFTGGVGHTVWLGVLVGSVALAANRAQLLPRWLTGAGLVAACLSLLSVLSIVLRFANLFIPLGRFGALLVIAAIGVTMATGRTARTTRGNSTAAAVLGGVAVILAAIAVMVLA